MQLVPAQVRTTIYPVTLSAEVTSPARCLGIWLLSHELAGRPAEHLEQQCFAWASKHALQIQSAQGKVTLRCEQWPRGAYRFEDRYRYKTIDLLRVEG